MLSSNHRKTAAALRWNTKRLAEKYGIERIGFLTLTFRDHVVCAREAQRRFHSLKTHVLSGRYVEWIRVLERMRSKRIHYHLLVVLPVDIRSGADFEQFEAGIYRTANDALRAEWAFWRATAPKYRFGRTEMLPVRSTQEAIAAYVGKYIAKHIGQREEQDKGVRLVAYSKGAGASNCRFAWASPGQDNHRRKLRFLANVLGYSAENYRSRFQQDFGSNWAFVLREALQSITFDTYPTAAHFLSDHPGHDMPPDVRDIVLTGVEAIRARRSQQVAVSVALSERERVSGAARRKERVRFWAGSSDDNPRFVHAARLPCPPSYENESKRRDPPSTVSRRVAGQLCSGEGSGRSEALRGIVAASRLHRVEPDTCSAQSARRGNRQLELCGGPAMIPDFPEIEQLSESERFQLLAACRFRDLTDMRPDSLWTEREITSQEYASELDLQINRLLDEATWRAAKAAVYR